MERYHGRRRAAGAVRYEFPVSSVARSCSPGPLSWQKRTAGGVEAAAAALLAIHLALTWYGPVMAGKVAVLSPFTAGINSSLVARSDQSGPCSCNLGVGLFSCGQILSAGCCLNLTSLDA